MSIRDTPSEATMVMNKVGSSCWILSVTIRVALGIGAVCCSLYLNNTAKFMGSLIPKRPMKGDIIQYVQNEISMLEALNVMIEADDSFVEKQQNRRRIDDRKDSKKNNSCFRKGYHKYEKDWKKSCRRNNRRNNRSISSQYMRTSHDLNWDNIHEFCCDIATADADFDEFYSFKEGGYEGYSCGSSIYVAFDRYYTEWDSDIEQYYDEFIETVYITLTYEQLVKWGLVE